ncbi:MAG: 16S rRNA (guanine966-N2)-methyltransferase [Alphaproteobacteria bacterium]|jgi:16S rRNA (guanine966-N2)-methyltransferase
MLRVIGGKHGGRRIATPPGDSTRPTSDRVREALFSILEAKRPLAGMRVLDACAGSGALGIEALSRGAAHATFFDTDLRAWKVVEDNIATLAEEASTDVRNANVTNPPQATEVCSLVFLDAPYRTDIASQALPALAAAGWFAPDALIVVETERGAELTLPNGFSETDSRAYSSTELHFLEYGG